MPSSIGRVVSGTIDIENRENSKTFDAVGCASLAEGLTEPLSSLIDGKLDSMNCISSEVSVEGTDTYGLKKLA